MKLTRGATLFVIGIAASMSWGVSFGGSDCLPRAQTGNSIPPQSTQYRVNLVAPDYRNAESVKQHFVFSRIWSAVLQDRLTSSTRGLCNSIVLPLIFPDLFVELFRADHNVTSERCLRELQSIVRDGPPSTARITQLSNSIATSLNKVPSREQLYVSVEAFFRKALREIYATGSVMHALMSVDAAAFVSVDADAFREWLNRQIGSLSIVKIPFCDEVNERVVESSGERINIPYSHVVSSGVVGVRVSLDEAPALDRLLLLGVPEQKGIGGQVPWQAESFSVGEFCNKRQKFKLSEQSEKDLQILCLHVAPFGSAWVVFFCDPRDCSRPDEADSALRTIRQSIEAHNEAQKLADGHEPRGPYLVEIQASKN